MLRFIFGGALLAKLLTAFLDSQFQNIYNIGISRFLLYTCVIIYIDIESNMFLRNVSSRQITNEITP